MNEINQLNPIKYTEVRKSSLEDLPPFFERRTAAESVRQAHRKKQSYYLEAALENEIVPNEKTLAAVSFAKEMILKILGIKRKDFKDYMEMMKVIFVSKDRYQKIFPKGSVGLMVQGLDEVFISYDENAISFLTASVAFHELMHRWVDVQHHAFHINDRDEFRIERRRHGATVAKLIRDQFTGLVSDTELSGEFINELGNFAWEDIFIRDLLNSQKMRSMFEDEIRYQSENLHKHVTGGRFGELYFSVNESGKKIHISGEHIWFNGSGDMLTLYMVLQQLTDDISSALRNIKELKGMSFRDLLLEIKIEPRNKKLLIKALNRSFGKQFYKELSEINLNSDSGSSKLLELLAQVQEFNQFRRQQLI